MKMIDFHNHVLPGLDDGPENWEQSLNMLRSAADQGTTDVVNTVHYQHPQMDGKDISNTKTMDLFCKLQERLENEDIDINLHLGAEVFYMPNLLSLVDHPLCTLGHGKYMLVEFPFHVLPKGYDKVLFELVMAGVTPIIAHPERHSQVHEDFTIISRFIQSGYLMQIDAGSILGNFGSAAERAARKMIKQDLCLILGSDAHNDHNRNFCLSEAVALCRDLIGEGVVALVSDNPGKILDGESMTQDLSDLQENSVAYWPNIKQRLFGGLRR